MPFSPRREYAQLITSGGQLLLLLIGFWIGTRTGWQFCLPLIAVFSLLAWRSSLNRLRAIRDTPTSRIASAAQGYVELIGRGMPFGEVPLLSRMRQLPCLWYRYQIEERYQSKNGTSWRTVESGESQDSFMLRDASGACIVDPEQAEISTIYRDHWNTGALRYTEWKLLKNDQIYVLGEFRTHSGAVEFDSNAELNALLAEWKTDLPALRKRFDLNNDGELDMAEWMLARKAAQREVTKKMRAAEAQPDLHTISQPRDGKLYLISNLTPADLSRRYLYWSYAHLLIFFAALGALGWVLQAKPLLE
ncbi:MAG: hypothetical protein HKM01_04700 [Gallionella sp.]|nr:hypothetical protein [Gallionella sp.]